MKRLIFVGIAAILLSSCSPSYRRYTYKIKIDAGSYAEAYAICKEEVEEELKKSLEDLRKYKTALYHSDSYETKELIKADCDRISVTNHLYDKKAKLKLGEICTVDDNHLFRFRKLVPDVDSVGDPDWNKTRIETTVPMSVVTYPCEK